MKNPNQENNPKPGRREVLAGALLGGGCWPGSNRRRRPMPRRRR